MKTFPTIIFTIFFSINAFCQIIDFDGRKINCDTAYTNLELGLCSRFLLEQSITKYDSLIAKINQCLDTLIKDDTKLRLDLLKENPSQTFDYWTDYVKIKEMLNQSDKTFREFAGLEMSIVGEFYGPGRERVIGENLRMKEVYDDRIKELVRIVEMHCG